jgi:hypothetical protein
MPYGSVSSGDWHVLTDNELTDKTGGSKLLETHAMASKAVVLTTDVPLHTQIHEVISGQPEGWHDAFEIAVV